MGERHLYDEPLRAIPVGDDLEVVVFAEPVSPENCGFRHRCSSWPDDQEPDGMLVKVVAPRLSKHTITGPESALTIRASILCPDCGLHGFVTDGAWAAC